MCACIGHPAARFDRSGSPDGGETKAAGIAIARASLEATAGARVGTRVAGARAAVRAPGSRRDAATWDPSGMTAPASRQPRIAADEAAA
jgi:hypothetical protein